MSCFSVRRYLFDCFQIICTLDALSNHALTFLEVTFIIVVLWTPTILFQNFIHSSKTYSCSKRFMAELNPPMILSITPSVKINLQLSDFISFFYWNKLIPSSLFRSIRGLLDYILKITRKLKHTTTKKCYFIFPLFAIFPEPALW